MDTDNNAIGAAIGRIPSGCAILTVQHERRETGVLVSWIQQASFDPPLLTVCIRRGRPVEELLEGAGSFAINILGEDAAAMLKHFGRGFALTDDAFAGLETQSSEFGRLLPYCSAHLGCRMIRVVEVGDHDIYIAQVVAGSGAVDRRPYVHVRKNGLSY